MPCTCTRAIRIDSLNWIPDSAASADEPYARSRDYDLQNVRTHLWLTADQKTIRGEVTHTISILREGVSEVRFDSVGLEIQEVNVDGNSAKHATNPNELVISLAHPAKLGERHEVLIRYTGAPKKGLFFVYPDKNYPQRPHEVWSQGESEDTRYYIPIYDYPNDRTTSEMILTVPANWTTISNGPSRRCENRVRRDEDLGLEAIRDALYISDLGRSRRIRRTARHLARDAGPLRGSAGRGIQDPVHIFAYEGNARRFFGPAQREISVGAIRPVVRERFCSWWHGKYERDNSDDAGTRPSETAAEERTVQTASIRTNSRISGLGTSLPAKTGATSG